MNHIKLNNVLSSHGCMYTPVLMRHEETGLLIVVADYEEEDGSRHHFISVMGSIWLSAKYGGSAHHSPDWTDEEDEAARAWAIEQYEILYPTNPTDQQLVEDVLRRDAAGESFVDIRGYIDSRLQIASNFDNRAAKIYKRVREERDSRQ